LATGSGACTFILKSGAKTKNQPSLLEHPAEKLKSSELSYFYAGSNMNWKLTSEVLPTNRIQVNLPHKIRLLTVM